MVGRQFGVWAARGALLAGLVALGGCSSSIITGVYGSPSDYASSTPSASNVPIRVDVDTDAECPQINVPTGSSFYSVKGAQITISNFARECDISGSAAVTIKVGVQGLAILGKGAGAGTYSAPLRISIRDRDSHVVYTKVQRVDVAVPPGGDQGTFKIVDTSSPIVIGVQQPLNSYDIVVGFDNKGAAQPVEKKKQRR
jgi:hypothetical protein